MDSNSNFHKKTLKWTAILGGLNFILSTFGDKETIKPELYSYYVFSNILGVLIAIFVLFYNQKKYSYKLKDLFVFSVTLWGIYSQFFISSGYLTVIISIFVYTLFNDSSFKKMLLFSVISLILTILSIFYSPTIIGETEELILIAKRDVIHTTIMMSLFSVITYFFKHKSLQKFKEIEAKMFDLGSRSSIFIHDLKNKAFPVVSNSKFLLKKQEGMNEYQKNILNEIVKSSNELNEFILHFNQNFSFKDQIISIDLRALINDIKKNNKKLSNIDFVVNQKEDLISDMFKIKSILENLFLNTAEACLDKQTIIPKIIVNYDKNILEVLDNAGGIPESKLKNINNDEFFTTKANGSGIGFYTIKKYVSLLKGSISFENKNNGFLIRIMLK